MALHGLARFTLAVPDPEPVAAFYRDFGLTETSSGVFATRNGGEQLRLVAGARRRVESVVVRAAHRDDVDAVAQRLSARGIAHERDGDIVHVPDETSGVTFSVEVIAGPTWDAPARPAANAPGRAERVDERAPAIDRRDPVRPRALSHVALTTTDVAATRALLVDGIGFRVSDEIPGAGAFLRCSREHHNVAVLGAPVAALHHSAWAVDDVDDVGRGGAAMVNADPARHLWGLGRHYLGSNYFWYLRDPAGNFAEYTADLDVIEDDAAWEAMAPADLRAIYAWGPPVPGDFIAPPDLVAEAGA